MTTGFAPQAMQYSTAPSFATNRTFMGSGFQPQSQFQLPVQDEPQGMQSQADDLEDAAFKAAFDAAMEDAFRSQEQETAIKVDQPSRTAKVDIYPHLPLIRIALLKAIMDGGDYLLHEAALFVRQLGRHDVSHMDPTQAMLLRPLINRLADQTRSPFAERYQMSTYLQDLDAKFQSIERNADITPENEQLLAAYADCLWGRDQSQPPQQMSEYISDTSYWRVSLEEHMENWHVQDPARQALTMLSETNLFGLETPQAMERVLDLEVRTYQDRLSAETNLSGQSPGFEDPQGLLYKMATALRDKPEFQQAIKQVRSEQSLSGNRADQLAQNMAHLDSRLAPEPHALTDYKEQLHLLETQNKARLMQARAEQDVVNIDKDTTMTNEQPIEEAHLDQAQQQQENQQTTKDDDELAHTAANLLDKVSHDKSDKFKNSAFLGLMRKLADREVKVDGDKMVQVSPFRSLL